MATEVINCKDCTREFEFTEKDQEFYAKNQFTPPKRCHDCRIKKKKKYEEQDKQY